MTALKSIQQIRKMTGLALVEVTIVLPILFLLMFASVEGGRLLYSYNTLTKLTRDAARLLSTRSFNGTVPDIELTAAKKAEVRNFLVYAKDNGGGAALLDNLSTSQVTVTSLGNYVIVAVDYPYSTMFGTTLETLSPGVNMNLNLHAEVTMRAIN